MKVLIIGGVAGGASAAARLRRLDENAEIIMIERGEYISYANCGLPYYIGGVIADKDELTLQTPESFLRRFNVDVRVCQEAVSIQRDKKCVAIHDIKNNRTYEESYDKLILSPGAEPIPAPVDSSVKDGVFTLRTVPDTFRITNYIEKQNPETAVVVGGGFIGLEVAENLTAKGIDITLVEMADQVMPQLDFDTACCVQTVIEQSGIKLMLGTGVKEISSDGIKLWVKTSDNALKCDMVIFAAGVRAESSLAAKAGLKLGIKGTIAVDEHMRTSDEDIYAVGDAVEVVNRLTGERTSLALAGPANRQGRLAADNICGIDRKFRGVIGSSVVKIFDMTLASTGINEKTAEKLGIVYDKVYLAPGAHASYYPGSSIITMKMLFEKNSGKILGAQLFGHKGVDKRSDVLATAICGGMTIYDLTGLELSYAPPYSSAKDPVNMAGFMAQNILEGRVKQYYWKDADNLPRDGSAELVDVRTPGEYARGHLEGFRNIPVDELRNRLDEIDKTKPLYINCQSGLRSYIASRILLQNGFDCSHLAGGWYFYSAVKNGRRFVGDVYACGQEKE